MTRTIIFGSLLALGACSAAQTSSINAVIAQGQSYCALATATGPLVVALANAQGVPVIVTNKTAQEVAAACALIGAIPVTPPANAAAAPVVAAPVAGTAPAKT